MAVTLGIFPAPSHKRNGKSRQKSSSLERNTIKYSGKIMARFASVNALRVIFLSPLATSVDTSHKNLGFWSVRLSELADTFFEYRFTKLRFKFTYDHDSLAVTTIAYGFQNLIGVVADPTSQYQVMDMPHSHVIMDSAQRPPLHVSLPKQYLKPALTSWLKCTTSADDNFELQGAIFLWCHAPAVESYVNSLEIDYAIEFRNPIYVNATPAVNRYKLIDDDSKEEPDSPVVLSSASRASGMKKKTV